MIGGITSQKSWMASPIEVMVKNSTRNTDDRLNVAKSVQLRDAKPLITLEQLITELVQKIDAEGGFIALSAEDDVPIAVHGNVSLPLTIPRQEEHNLFSGDPVLIQEHLCYPFSKNNFVVGFIALRIGGFGLDESHKHLIDVYATLASKELELADKTAKLQYQNEKVSRKQRQLEQAISFKNNILSLTTHDLRSPLNAVMGYLEMLEDEMGEDEVDEIPNLHDYKNKIKTGVSNISDLIDQLNEIALLELQRIELNLIKVDLNWVVQEVCDVMQGPAVAKSQNLLFTRHDKPLYAEVDIPKAKRILFNLVGNAIKYTEEGGDIEIWLEEQKSMAHIFIKDNGIGIPDEKLKAIFEPFKKINQKGTNGEVSTGLGLFTSNYMARLFKGSITVDSQEQKGSVFCVHLPIASLGF